MKDLEKAKELLYMQSLTCAMCKSDCRYTFTERGISPLLKLYDEKICVKDFSAADKVVGKGAAFMYLLLEIKNIYAAVISRSALELLKQNGVYVEYDTVAENIINRSGDGICPFEQAVLDVNEKYEAYKIISEKMRLFQKN